MGRPIHCFFQKSLACYQRLLRSPPGKQPTMDSQNRRTRPIGARAHAEKLLGSEGLLAITRQTLSSAWYLSACSIGLSSLTQVEISPVRFRKSPSWDYIKILIRRTGDSESRWSVFVRHLYSVPHQSCYVDLVVGLVRILLSRFLAHRTSRSSRVFLTHTFLDSPQLTVP